MTSYGLMKSEAAENKEQVIAWWKELSAKAESINRYDLVEKFQPDFNRRWQHIDARCVKLRDALDEAQP